MQLLIRLTNQARKTMNSSLSQFFKKKIKAWWDLLTEPHFSITGPFTRSRARILSALLMGLLIVGVVSLIINLSLEFEFSHGKLSDYDWLVLLGLAFLLSLYSLSRTRHYRLAALAFILGFTALIYLDILYTRESSLDLAYLILGILMSSLFFSRRSTEMLLIAIMVAVVFLRRLVPELPVSTLFNLETFLISTGLMVITLAFVRQRDQLRLTMQAEELKEQAKALRLSEEKYRSLVNDINDGMFETDLDGVLTFVNPALVRICGFDQPDELIGRNFLEFILPDSREQVQRELAQFFEVQKMPEEITMDVIDRDGHLLFLEGKPVLIVRDGKVMGVRGVLRDGTARVIADNELRSARDMLERRVEERTAELAKASRLKDEFLASVSHDLRTPLTSILGLAEALQLQTYGSLSEKQLAALKQVEMSGRALLEMINNTLDYAMIEAGRVKVNLMSCSVMNACRASVDKVKTQIEEKNLHISMELGDSNGLMVRADARLLKQILGNLLSNALKFTPEGGSLGIEVGADEVGELVKITVWDTGIGIQAEDIQHLFVPFIHLDKRLARLHSGIGLGLALVQRLVELHGGTVGVESKPGVGSRITVKLPRA